MHHVKYYVSMVSKLKWAMEPQIYISAPPDFFEFSLLYFIVSPEFPINLLHSYDCCLRRDCLPFVLFARFTTFIFLYYISIAWAEIFESEERYPILITFQRQQARAPSTF